MSKPTGRNASLRICRLCDTNKRNMERRVQGCTEGDALKVWWANLQKEKEGSMKWYRKMKSKDRNAKMLDGDLMMETV